MRERDIRTGRKGGRDIPVGREREGRGKGEGRERGGRGKGGRGS